MQPIEHESDRLLCSDEPFFPSETYKNLFLGTTENFSAVQFNKPKPGSWIPKLSEHFTVI
ncbi:MAG: hypothetical protein ABFR02_03375 [Campylobacterota bacterium]